MGKEDRCWKNFTRTWYKALRVFGDLKKKQLLKYSQVAGTFEIFSICMNSFGASFSALSSLPYRSDAFVKETPKVFDSMIRMMSKRIRQNFFIGPSRMSI